jgi:hypothetical protein
MKRMFGYTYFHTHPNLEMKLHIDKDHVIVDKDEFLAVLRFIQSNPEIGKQILEQENPFKKKESHDD